MGDRLNAKMYYGLYGLKPFSSYSSLGSQVTSVVQPIHYQVSNLRLPLPPHSTLPISNGSSSETLQFLSPQTLYSVCCHNQKPFSQHPASLCTPVRPRSPPKMAKLMKSQLLQLQRKKEASCATEPLTHLREQQQHLQNEI